jgi:hypothetical protein
LNTYALDVEVNSIFDMPNQTGSPERRLLMAIFERALLDYVGNDKREYEEAKEWLFEGMPNEQMIQFSFSWICHQLDLELDEIRKKIIDMPRRGASRIAPWYLTKGYHSKDGTKDTNDKSLKKLKEKKTAKILNFSNKIDGASVN